MLSKLSYQNLAKEIIYPFIGDFMTENELSDIVDKSYSVFRKDNVIDLIKLGDTLILELFHGPTLAFKDIAMQLLGNFYEHYLKKNNKDINVVVATSGDTGAAAIDAIKGKKNMNIFVLHPHEKVSLVQRKLMSTVKEKNVFNIAIKGNFDDCQNLVKSMFADKEFSNSINMSGVNSINWARIIAHIIENTAMKAPIVPRPSKPPVRSPPENIVPTSEKRPPPALAQITIIKKIITA